MVPTRTGHGYFMVASDGGVFAFGDARFEGSCPGIGGCSGAAVAVMPDQSGNGYWLVTANGGVYAFGDAPFYGDPPPSSVPVVDAVATPDGHGYWILYANGGVSAFGDAAPLGAPLGYVNSFNPAAAIFPTADGRGYWVAAARGDVFTYGDAPFLGSMSATGLNGQIIAAYRLLASGAEANSTRLGQARPPPGRRRSGRSFPRSRTPAAGGLPRRRPG